MKFKNILKYGFALLAMGAMLTGCSNNGKLLTATTDRSGGNMEQVTPQKGDIIATFEIEGHGTIKAVLFPDIAPVGVENFQKLCNDGFYKGLTIHRVSKGFMFQGGSTNGNGTGGDAMVNGGSFGVEASENARHFYGALCYANYEGQNSTQFYIVNDNETDPFDKMIKRYNELIEECQRRANTSTINDEKDYYQYLASQYTAARDNYSASVDTMDPEIKSRYDQRGGAPSLDGGYTVFGQVYEGFDVIESISNVEVVENGSGEKSKPVQTITIKDVTVSLYK